MSAALLPPQSTLLERTLATVMAHRLDALPVPIRSLSDPATCPESLLGWLAWAHSVDVWDNDWPVQLKRAAIAASFGVHRTKGTVGAVRRALDALGIGASIDEWFNHDGEPGTFRIDAFADVIINAGYQVDAALVALVSRMIDHVKPARAHYSLRVGESLASHIGVRSAVRERIVDDATHVFAAVPA